VSAIKLAPSQEWISISDSTKPNAFCFRAEAVMAADVQRIGDGQWRVTVWLRGMGSQQYSINGPIESTRQLIQRLNLPLTLEEES
jgi:hypothetical protein